MYSFRFVEPAPQLKSFVLTYAQRTSVLPPGCTIVHPVTARSRSLIEFVFGDRFVIDACDGGSPRFVESSIVGVQTRRRLNMVLRGRFDSFSIHFRPTGLARLFGIPATELTDADYEVGSVLGPSFRSLEERLGNLQFFEERVHEVNATLSRLIRNDSHNAIDLAAERIALGLHGVRMSDFAASTGWSQRQFERNFVEGIGVSPKRFARIVRFEAAVAMKARASQQSWTDIAHVLGYHDQMHMIREFKEFSGAAPVRMLEEATESIESVQRGWTRAAQTGPLLL